MLNCLFEADSFLEEHFKKGATYRATLTINPLGHLLGRVSRPVSTDVPVLDV